MFGGKSFCMGLGDKRTLRGGCEFRSLKRTLQGRASLALDFWFFQWHGADVFAFAGVALLALPEGVELVEDAFDHFGRRGPDSPFEVSAAIGFCAQARAGEVGAAQVHGPGVDHDGFGVEAGAAPDGHVLWQAFFEFDQRG